MTTELQPEQDVAPVAPVDPEGDVRMTIWEHLGELRKRLLRAAIALLAGASLSWAYKEKLLEWIARPCASEWNVRFPTTPFELQTLAPTDTFVNYMQLAVTGGVVLATPVIFFQLWAFVSPGLYAKEKRYIVPFILFSTVLFGLGIAFCYYALFPAFYSYQFSLLGSVGSGVTLTHRPTMEYLIDFATRFLLACGFAFEMPLFIALLAIGGVVTPNQLVRFGRWAVIGAFVVGAFITPGPEVLSQIIVSTALVALYFAGVGLAFLVSKRRDESSASP